MAASLLFLFGAAVSAGEVLPSDPIEGPLEVACADEAPVMVLVVEVTIPGLFDRRAYRFPLKRKTPPSLNDSLHLCVGGYSENGDGFDPTGQVATYYGASAYIDRLRSSSARVDLSFYWKTATAKGDFDRKLSVPLFEPKEFTFRDGVVVRTYRGK